MRDQTIWNDFVGLQNIKEFSCKMRIESIKKKEPPDPLLDLTGFLFPMFDPTQRDLIVCVACIACGNTVPVREIRKIPCKHLRSLDNQNWVDDITSCIDSL